MSDPRTDLPSAQSANFNQRIRETLMTYLGRQGNPLDRGLTVRDLIEAGLVQVVAGKTLKPGAGTPPIEPKPGSTNEEPDLTPPPTPTGFSVSAAISHVFITHDAPLYRQGHGHLRTRVYAKVVQTGDPAPTFADATEVAQFSGTTFALPTNPSTTWHLWIKWETVDGVVSAAPAGGTNGLSVTTGQDVSLLLDALAGEIAEDQMTTGLVGRIDLIDGDVSLAGSVNFRLAEEAAARVAAIAIETQARTDALAAETQARNDAIAAEAAQRNEGLSLESRTRLLQVQEAAEAALRAIVAAENERIDRQQDVAIARQELRTDFEAGILAEATARLELTAVVNQNVADILSEQTARSTADSALAADITVLFAQVDDNAAAIQDEATARATGDAAEASARNLLATQFRGSYTGTDINAVTEGLLYQERLARSTQDNALAQQITLLSAGAGEQFDWKAIWYFDDGVEGWTGNGTPTVTQGWLRPADQASDAYVVSPTGIDSDGNKYSQVRLRIRKTGTPTFAGYLWWRTASDTTWDTARRIALTEPTFDANGIGLITVSPAWAVTIDRLRVDLSSAQTATDCFEIDWVAVGRPSPGASSAQLLEEQETRANADIAEANARKTLSSILVGQDDPTGLTLPSLSSGLLYEERQARSTQDGALATSISTLQATVTSNFTTLDAAITTEEEARIDADSAEATARQTLTSVLLGVTDPTGLTLETLASGLLYDERQTRVTQDSALATSISGLSATLGDVQADIITLQETAVDLEEASAQVSRTLVAADRRTTAALENQAETALRDVLALDAESRERKATLAVISEDLTVKINDGLLAEAQARWILATRLDANTASLQEEITVRTLQNEATTIQLTTLSSRVDQNAAGIRLESQTRATTDSALASQISTLSATVGDNTAAIQAESTARVNADGALSSQIATLTATVGANTAAITTESTARATADNALSSQITTLSASVGANASAIQAEQTARANADNALATSISTLSTTVGNQGASIVELQETTVDLESAIATSSRTLAAGDKRLGAALDAQAVTSLRDLLNLAAETEQTRETFAIINEDLTVKINDGLLAEARARWTLTALVEKNAAAIQTEQVVRALADEAEATERVKLSAQVQAGDATLASAIQNEATARANAIAAEASARQTLQATVESNAELLTAAIQSEAEVRASQTGALSGKYTIKVDLAGHVSGFGLASEANVNEAPVSRFGIRASQFFVAPPSTVSATAPTTNLYKGRVWVDTSVTPNVTRYYTGSGWSTEPQALPFVVQAEPTTINGVAVPAGVYLGDAFIENGTITNAKIANLAVDDAKIANLSVSKLTAGSVAVGEYIQSTGFISGSAGFRIDGNGNAEFNDGTFRGTVYAAAGEIGGSVLGADFLRSTNFSAGSAGWRLKSDGTAEFGAAAIRGQLTADQIDTKGLTIKDASGTTVFSASVALAGAYIANGAITTAKIGDAQITTAKINDAAITSAKIGDAQVGTLKIGTNAVTVPGGATALYMNSSREGASIELTLTANQTVAIIASIDTYDSAGPAGETRALIMRGSTEVGKFHRATQTISTEGGTTYLSHDQSVCLTDTGVSADGTYTYKIVFPALPAGGTGVSVRSSIVVIQCKR